jgi:hypothetical protein
MYAGVAGAVGGAVVYLKQDELTEGWEWVSSHMEFIGCLARGSDLRNRVNDIVKLNEELGVGFANLYTRLGKRDPPRQLSIVGTLTKQRTFCNLPSKATAGTWREAINEKASDEIWAHMSAFPTDIKQRYD